MWLRAGSRRPWNISTYPCPIDDGKSVSCICVSVTTFCLCLSLEMRRLPTDLSKHFGWFWTVTGAGCLSCCILKIASAPLGLCEFIVHCSVSLLLLLHLRLLLRCLLPLCLQQLAVALGHWRHLVSALVKQQSNADRFSETGCLSSWMMLTEYVGLGVSTLLLGWGWGPGQSPLREQIFASVCFSLPGILKYTHTWFLQISAVTLCSTLISYRSALNDYGYLWDTQGFRGVVWCVFV